MGEGGAQGINCTSCGQPASGKFCSGCGASLAGGRMQFVEDLPVLGEPIAFVRTFFKILRAPIEEPIRLVETPEYRGHFRFLMIGVGVFAAFVLLVFASMRQESKQPYDPSQATLFDNYLYNLLINYTIGAVIAFALFRLFGGRNAGVQKHAKLWSILTGFYLPLQMLLLVAIAVAGLVLIQLSIGTQDGVNATFTQSSPYIFVAFNAVMALHFALAHARVWQAPFWKSLLLIIAAVLLAQYPMYLFQYAFGYVMGLWQGLGATG